jgi:hypothetical protein
LNSVERAPCQFCRLRRWDRSGYRDGCQPKAQIAPQCRADVPSWIAHASELPVDQLDARPARSCRPSCPHEVLEADILVDEVGRRPISIERIKVGAEPIRALDDPDKLQGRPRGRGDHPRARSMQRQHRRTPSPAHRRGLLQRHFMQAAENRADRRSRPDGRTLPVAVIAGQILRIGKVLRNEDAGVGVVLLESRQVGPHRRAGRKCPIHLALTGGSSHFRGGVLLQQITCGITALRTKGSVAAGQLPDDQVAVDYRFWADQASSEQITRYVNRAQWRHVGTQTCAPPIDHTFILDTLRMWRRDRVPNGRSQRRFPTDRVQIA